MKLSELETNMFGEKYLAKLEARVGELENKVGIRTKSEFFDLFASVVHAMQHIEKDLINKDAENAVYGFMLDAEVIEPRDSNIVKALVAFILLCKLDYETISAFIDRKPYPLKYREKENNAKR